MSQDLRVGIIGCGGISRAHFGPLLEIPSVQLAAVCDNVPERAAAMAAKYAPGARQYTDYREMLEKADLDVVHIITPHHEHAPMAVAALEKGLYVLSEKPMATQRSAARAMIEADRQKRLGIVFQNRFNQSTARCRQILQEGELGALQSVKVSVTWYRDAAYYAADAWRGKWATEGGGVLINQAIHTIDLAYHLVGPFARLKGQILQGLLEHDIEVEDNAQAVFHYQNGLTGLLHASNNFRGDDHGLVLQCEKGALHLRGENLWLVQNDDVSVLVKKGQVPAGMKPEYGNGHQVLIDNFYNCIRRQEAFPISGQEAYPALWAVLATYESARTGRWIDFA